MKILVCFPFSAAERGTLDDVARQPLANVTNMKAGF